MASDNDDLRNISDTARWVAIYRAIESDRPDALFHDPFARRLAGERGERIAETMEFANRHAWSFVARTVVFDRLIEDSIASGADMVVNLAAGLDTRPYRMALPANLPWIEVDPVSSPTRSRCSPTRPRAAGWNASPSISPTSARGATCSTV